MDGLDDDLAAGEPSGSPEKGLLRMLPGMLQGDR
jgi:hypothetical protein